MCYIPTCSFLLIPITEIDTKVWSQRLIKKFWSQKLIQTSDHRNWYKGLITEIDKKFWSQKSTKSCTCVCVVDDIDTQVSPNDSRDYYTHTHIIPDKAFAYLRCNCSNKPCMYVDVVTMNSWWSHSSARWNNYVYRSHCTQVVSAKLLQSLL